MLVHDLFRRSAARTPDAACVVTNAGCATYRDIQDRSDRVANSLIARGVTRGDRVLIALDNSIDFVAAYFGTLAAGGVAVPLAPGARNDRLWPAIRDCAPVAGFVERATLDTLLPELDKSSLKTLLVRGVKSGSDQRGCALEELDEALSAAGDGAPRVPGIDVDLAAIVYTSGSTGEPRGVMLSHLNLVANTASIVEYLRLTAADRVIVVLPFFYVYGLSLLHTHVAIGGSVVLENRFAFPNVVLDTMQRHSVTGFAGVPSTFALLLHKSRIAATPLTSLRYVTQAGGAMPPARIREWTRAVPGVPLYVMYGATEAGARLAYLDPGELADRAGSIGRAIPNVELRVLRDDDTAASAGEVGEIVARGSNIAAGYWGRPEETRERFGPAGFRTGDLAYADEDGFLYVVGRRHDMIKVGAHRVGAKEIEDALCEHPAVHEAAVIASPDDLLGEIPVAFVTVRNGEALADGDLIRFCRSKLPDYKVPARVLILDDMPKNSSGKIDKRHLRTLMLTAEHA
jgi:acyl-CoA synthetase (AMP-forming)/AMP-acid ligase II